MRNKFEYQWRYYAWWDTTCVSKWTGIVDGYTTLREGITLMKRRMLNSAFWALFTSNQALEGYHHQRALLSEVKGDIFFTSELGPYILFPPLGSSQSGLFWQIIPPYSISFHPFLVNSFSFLFHSSTILAISTDFRMFPPHSFLF